MEKSNNAEKNKEKVNMKTEVIIALIAAVATILTIIGSIIATNLTNTAQIEAQRIEAVRDMKRTYYTAFIDAYTKKIEYVFMPSSVEQVEANMKFAEEANKLPLYASQDVVEYIEQMKDPRVAQYTSSTKLFELIRADLCSNEFNIFEDLGVVSLTVPNEVIIDSTGDKQIQSKTN